MNWYGRCGRDSIWAGIINAVISGVQNGNVDRTAGSFSGAENDDAGKRVRRTAVVDSLVGATGIEPVTSTL